MTILLNVIKHCVGNILEEIGEASKRADASGLNWLGSFFGASRRPDVAEKKRGITRECHKLLDEFEDAATDELTCAAISNMLLAKKAEAAKESSRLGCLPGLTETGLTTAISLIGDIKQKFATLKLQDIPVNNDPYNIFCHCLGWYFAKKVHDELKAKSAAEKVTGLMSSAVGLHIDDDKEGLVCTAMSACQAELMNIDKGQSDDPDWLRGRRAYVTLAELHKLRNANAALCRDRDVILEVPVITVSLLSAKAGIASVGPTIGSLELAIAHAEAAIVTPDLQLRAGWKRDPVSATAPGMV